MKNPVRGVRATIENLISRIQWLCHRFQRFVMFWILFAIIMSPAFAGFEMCLFLEGKNADDADEQDLTQVFIFYF